MISEDTLWKYALLSEKNRNNAWVGPNVAAELLALRTPLILTDWTPAGYFDGSVSLDGKKVLLRFQLPTSTTQPAEMQLTAKLRAGWIPKNLLVNGKPNSFTVKNGKLTATLRGNGIINVGIF